ncbi:hypothetical protein F5884DRAFT_855386 [Xylogone sp. PMI_703]|nr:hypothetical protein F5884DRAFT_855386 [Xylogone sp. PMI_703]
MGTAKAAPLVWINGFPGSGKLTVAKAIATLHHNTIVLDNHKLIDPVEARFSRTHPDYQKERRRYRQAVLDEYVCDAAMLSKLVICTDFQSSNELGRSVAMEYEAAADKAGRVFVPIYLTCDIDVNLERIGTLDRVNSGTTKLTDIRVLKDMCSRCELFCFDDRTGLTIDSTHVPPLETARNILVFLQESSNYDCVVTL